MKTYRQIVHDLSLVYPENEARALARWLCEERFGLTQSDILLDKDNHFSADDLANLKEITSRLIKHEPIQYILGYTTFCGHRFDVGPGVLIPRPETAELVTAILRSLASRSVGSVVPLPELPSPRSVGGAVPISSRSVGGALASPSILDIGTGSGCIALSLALALPEADVTGWDLCPEALEYTRRNAERYPEAHVHFEQADIFDPPKDDRQWDIIVSNPPYVRQSEAATMEDNVLRYEPHEALFVPDDSPLLYYHAIAKFAISRLKDEGQLWLEINEALGEETAHFIEDFGFMEVELMKDDYGKDRMLKCSKKS